MARTPDSTYTIRDGALTCHLCGATSFNATDVAQAYCGRCHLFHGLVAELRGTGFAHECSEWATAASRCAICDALVRGRARPEEEDAS